MNLNWRNGDEIICPFCDYQYEQSNEFCIDNTDCGELVCEKCEKPFKWEAEFVINFITRRIEGKSE